jgi:hypothetical protein
MLGIEFDPLPPLPFTLRSFQTTYRTAMETENDLREESNSKDGATTDTGDDTDQIFDSDDEDEVTPEIDGDDTYADENMDLE